MNSKLHVYEPGDWVVHRNHGIGKIKSIERKSIGEEETTYCKIETHDSTIWLPIDKANGDWLRPVATPTEIKTAQKILQSPPQPMADNINSRKSQIKNVNSNDKPAIIAELLRDLRALKKEKTTLAQTEEASLRHFTDCFVSEWAVSMDISRDEAQQQFEALIQLGRKQAADDSS